MNFLQHDEDIFIKNARSITNHHFIFKQGIWGKTNEWDECVAYLLDQGSQSPCWAGESSLYSDDERQELGQIFTMIAQYECFKHYFHETCYELYGQDNDDYYTK